MLEQLQKKIERLIALYEAGKVENDRLRALLAERDAAVEDYRNQITGLKEQIDTLKLKEAFIGGISDNAAARARVEKMIRSVDRCISILEK